MEKEKDFFANLPKETGGLVMIAGGLLILATAWFNWEWIFQGDGRVINLAWISDTFGRTAARIIVGIMGVIIILCGVVLAVLMK